MLRKVFSLISDRRKWSSFSLLADLLAYVQWRLSRKQFDFELHTMHKNLGQKCSAAARMCLDYQYYHNNPRISHVMSSPFTNYAESVTTLVHVHGVIDYTGTNIFGHDAEDRA